MTRNALDAYRQAHVTTADRGELLLALYDGALGYLDQARAALARRDIPAKGRYLDAVLAIIMEFSRTLDPAEVPELVDNLRRLYAYLGERITEGSRHLDEGPLVEVDRHLRALRDTWRQAVAIARREGALGPASAPGSAG